MEASRFGWCETGYMGSASTLAEAFQDDPLFSWVQPDFERRRRGLLPLYQAVVRRCNALGGVVDVADGGGVAGWVPAGRTSVSTVDLFRFGLLATPLWLGTSAAMRLSRHDAAADLLIEDHAMAGDAYLWALGTDPYRRGHGYARLAVEECLSEASRSGAGRVLLKTENPRNVTLYEHLGFHVLAEQQVEVSGLTVWVFARPVSRRAAWGTNTPTIDPPR